VSRLATRWAGGDRRKIRLALIILLTLPGTATLYYGDELGMTDVDVPVGLRRDPMTWAAGTSDDPALARGESPTFNRDAARTPMRWTGAPGAGFTRAGVTPWLPAGDGGSVASQRDDPGSPLTLTRRLLALRRAELSGGVAPYAELAVSGDGWSYTSGGLAVAVNLSDSPVTVPHSDDSGVLLTTPGAITAHGDSRRWLAPWAGIVWRKDT